MRVGVDYVRRGRGYLVAASIIGRRFDPKFCCSHQWVKTGKRGERCSQCGATCERASDGTVETYTASGYADAQ